MKRPCRFHVSVLLALLIAVTTVHAGTMRGQAKATGSIVLCTGSGPVSVAVDADGQPVGATHACPDCVMSVMVAVEARSAAPHRIALARRLSVTPERVTGWSRAVTRPRARGPPRLS